MAVKRETVTFTALSKEIKSGTFRNIYVLQGEEPYFIDSLQQLIIDTVLTEDQRDFNLSLYYGNTANVREVISACQQYPAFSQYKVVVVREAQLIAKQPGHKMTWTCSHPMPRSHCPRLFSLSATKAKHSRANPLPTH